MVDRQFGSSDSGLTGYALRNPATGDVVIAFRGTNDLADWGDNIGNLGWRQWQQAAPDVRSYLNANWSTGELTFAGHSLGGALSQYAAYDLAGDYASRRGQLNVYTLNGLGGINGINENVPGGYDPSRMTGIDARNYFNPEDVVARIGGGHVGDTYNVGDFRAGPDGVLGAHDADGFNDARLSGAVPQLPGYYDSPTLQQNPELVADIVGSIALMTGSSNPAVVASAAAKLIDTLKHIPPGELGETGRLVLDVVSGLAVDAANGAAGAIADAADWLGDLANALAEEVGGVIGDIGDAIGGVPGNAFAQGQQAALRRLIDPIVLDLDGDGVELIARDQATVYFDMDGDGIRERTGWYSGDDALLVVDANRNGRIRNRRRVDRRPRSLGLHRTRHLRYQPRRCDQRCRLQLRLVLALAGSQRQRPS